MSERYEDDNEIFIREVEVSSRNQAVYDPIPSQWTLSQCDEERSPAFPSWTRTERIQQERHICNIPRSESDSILSQGNDFAVLEALLEDQHKINGASPTNKDRIDGNADKETRTQTTMKRISVGNPGNIPFACTVTLTRDDTEDELNKINSVVSTLTKHPSKQLSKVHSQDERRIEKQSLLTNPVSSLAETNLRQRSRKGSAVVVPHLFSNSSLNHNSLLEKSRKMARQNNKQQSTRIFEKTQSQSTATTSIVGSRPTHWDHRDLLSLSNKRKVKSLDRCEKTKRGAVLSSFTQQNFHERRTPRANRQLYTPVTEPVPNFSPIQDPIVEDVEKEKPSHAASCSFAPTFLSIAPNSSSNPSNTLASSGLPSPQMQVSNTRCKKSKAMFSGRLCKRLQSIRDSVRGDKIRFQSGQYPFSIVSLDMNDPRNRATSILNITVVEASGISNYESQRVLVLGFVHDATGSSSQLRSQFSWICFACDTARELNMQKGSRLRIYNAISMEMSGPLHSSQDSRTFPTVKRAILATTLCELYPAVLPELPDVSIILREHGSLLMHDATQL